MAQTKTSASSTSKKQATAAEIREWYNEHKRSIENFEVAQDAWKQLRDVKKNVQNKTISQLTKESVMEYLQNPSTNEKNLRTVSDYLYYRSHIYMRIVNFYADMVMPSARVVIPEYDFVKTPKDNNVLKSYNETISILDRMNLDLYAKTIWTYCLKEDVFYGLYWLDDTGLTMINIPADYGKIDGVYSYGNFSWSMDMTWFNRRKDYIEWWGEPVTSMWNEYQSTGEKWQKVPPSASVCFKFRMDDPDIVIPPFAGLFGQFADLEDLADYEAIQAAQNIYKLIWMELETISGSKNVDDFKIDVTMANEYFQKMVDSALPDYTAAALVPGKLNTIEFQDDAATQTSKYEKSMGDILDVAGGGQVLLGSNINNTAAFNASMVAAERFALTTLLPQLEAWVKMMLDENMSNPCKVKFFAKSPYTIRELKDDLLSAAQNGMPTALAYNNLNNLSEKDTMSLNNLQTILGIPNILKPLNTSYTQSSTEDGYTSEIGQGAPEKDATELKEDNGQSK